MLRDSALDLLILDIALPEHEDSGDPVKDGGITLLGELTASNRFKMPKHVIGLTALAEIHEDAVSRFGSELWSVLRYDPATGVLREVELNTGLANWRFQCPS